MQQNAISTKLVKQIEKFFQEQNSEKIIWVEADEARKLLGRGGKELKKETLSSYISRGTISPSAYKTAVNGKKFFNKKKLMGLDD